MIIYIKYILFFAVNINLCFLGVKFIQMILEFSYHVDQNISLLIAISILLVIGCIFFHSKFGHAVLGYINSNSF